MHSWRRLALSFLLFTSGAADPVAAASFTRALHIGFPRDGGPAAFTDQAIMERLTGATWFSDLHWPALPKHMELARLLGNVRMVLLPAGGVGGYSSSRMPWFGRFFSLILPGPKSPGGHIGPPGSGISGLQNFVPPNVTGRRLFRLFQRLKQLPYAGNAEKGAYRSLIQGGDINTHTDEARQNLQGWIQIIASPMGLGYFEKLLNDEEPSRSEPDKKILLGAHRILIDELSSDADEIRTVYRGYTDAQRGQVLTNMIDRFVLEADLYSALDQARAQLRLLRSRATEREARSRIDVLLLKIEREIIPRMQILGDTRGYLFQTGAEWLGWYGLEDTLPDEEWPQYVDDLIDGGYEEAVVIIAGMLPPRMRQGADTAHQQIYPKLLHAVMRNLSEVLPQLDEEMPSDPPRLEARAEVLATVLLNMFHYDPAYGFAIQPNGVVDGEDSALLAKAHDIDLRHPLYAKSAIDQLLAAAKSRFANPDPANILHKTLRHFRRLLNAEGPLPQVFRFMDRRPAASVHHTGREILEIFAEYYERQGGPRADGTDPTIQEFIAALHPVVQEFLRDRKADLNDPQWAYLNNIRNALASDFTEKRRRSNPRRLTGLISSARNSGDIEKALRHAERGVQEYPEDHILRSMFADILHQKALLTTDDADLRASLLQRAETAAESALRLKPDDPKSHGILGRILFEQGNIRAAIAEIKMEVSLKPTAKGRWMLADLMDQERDFNGALEQLQLIQNMEPNNPRAFFRQVRINIKQNRIQVAFEIAHAASQRFPTLADSHYWVAILQMKRQAYDQVIKEAETFKLYGGDATVASWLTARALIKKQNLTLAQLVLTRALADDPEKYVLHRELVLVDLLMGRIGDAKVHLDWMESHPIGSPSHDPELDEPVPDTRIVAGYRLYAQAMDYMMQSEWQKAYKLGIRALNFIAGEWMLESIFADRLSQNGFIKEAVEFVSTATRTMNENLKDTQHPWFIKRRKESA